MQSLPARKNPRKRNQFIGTSVAVFLLAILIIFPGVTRSLGHAGEYILTPVLHLGQSIGRGFSAMGTNFRSKRALQTENDMLKQQLVEAGVRIADRDVLATENADLKDILGRKGEGNLVLATIISKPSRSPYDTVVVDIGANAGISAGAEVFAYGNIPIGSVREVYPTSAKIELFSTPGHKELVTLQGTNIQAELTGRGVGNFEMTLSREVAAPTGTAVLSTTLTPYVIGTVQKILSDPRDPFQKILIMSPVNIQQLKWVEIRK